MHSSPLVSIVIPAFNAARWIDCALLSARAQTCGDHEIIVIDDGSTDDTADKAGVHARADARVQVIHQPNAGVGAARNAGIQRARGQFIAPLDADDEWLPEKLEKQLRRFDEWGPRAGMVYCWTYRLDAQGAQSRLDPGELPEGRIARRLIHRNYLGNASLPLIRKEALDQVGHYLTRDEQSGAQGCEDWDLSLRLTEKWEVALVPEYLVGYRWHGDNMSSGTAGMTASFQCVLERARQRNPNVPPALFRWSSAVFHKYLATNELRHGRYKTCLHLLTRAVSADPALMLNSQIPRMACSCLSGWLFGRPNKPLTPHPVPSPPCPHAKPKSPRPYSIFARIQQRRANSDIWNAD